MDEKTKKLFMYGGIAAVILIFILLFRRAGSSSSTTLYTTGVSSSDAAAVSIAGINASAAERQAYYGEQAAINIASDQLAYGKDLNAANVSISGQHTATLQQIYDAEFAAEQAIALDTNRTNRDIVANLGSTEQGLKPSWIDNLLQLSSFGGQFGDTQSTGTSTSTQGTGATNALSSFFSNLFGGGRFFGGGSSALPNGGGGGGLPLSMSI